MKITNEDGKLLDLKNTIVEYKFVIADESENYLEKNYNFVVNK